MSYMRQSQEGFACGSHHLNKLADGFVRIAGIILCITSFAKLISASGTHKVLNVVDPVSGITFRHLMLLAGVAELAIGLYCIFARNSIKATVLIAWAATGFIAYRLSLWWVDWNSPCLCFGNLTDALHISPETADTVAKILLTFLTVGSYLILIYNRKEKGAKYRAPTS
jgi:hypothetical protein